MDTKTKISLCITTFNRVETTMRSFEQVVNDPRIGDIVISDDHSDPEIYRQLATACLGIPRLTLWRNPDNRGVYHNKFLSVAYAKSDYCIVFDSDNTLGTDYIDRLYQLYPWDPFTAYLPEFARPTFDYRHFAGSTITHDNVGSFLGKKMFDCLINTMNAFYNRKEYLRIWDGETEPLTADSMYMNYLYLKAGNRLKVVPGLQYDHAVHDGSHYKKHAHRNGAFTDRLLNQYKMMH